MSTTLSPLFSWRGQIADSTLGATARHVALTLSLHMSERGDSCFPGIRTLASECGRSPTTITAGINELEAEGWLKVERGGGRKRPNRYTATLPINVTEAVTLGEETLQSDPSNVTAVVTEDVLLRGRKPLQAPPAERASKTERDSVWDALVAEFGTPTMTTHGKRFGKTQRELLSDSSLSPAEVAAEIPLRARRYRAKWPGADLTLEALVKHWPDLRSVNGNGGANGNGGYGTSPLPELPAGQTF